MWYGAGLSDDERLELQRRAPLPIRPENLPREVVETWLHDHRRCLARAGTLAVQELAAPAGAKPPAAILDIDEVLLCNVYGQPMGDGHFVGDLLVWPPGMWPGVLRWARDAQYCPAMPGAHGLLQLLYAAGVRVFFVSGRKERLRDITIDNFVRVGLISLGQYEQTYQSMYLAPEAVDSDVAPFKRAVREQIGRGYRVLVSVGDQLSDLGPPALHNVLCPHGFYVTR